MPAPWIRRPLTITIWLIVSILYLLVSPLALAAAASAGAITRRPQAMIAARMAVAYFARELATLVACGALWLASGAGLLLRRPAFQTLHWRLVGWYVHGLARRAIKLLDIEFAPDPCPDAEAALRGEEPLIVFSRHAGPGDTVLMVDQLVSRYHRRPSVVLKEAVALDPCVDLLAHRLPHAVLDPADREEAEARIANTSAGLGKRGVLLLYPEGANFSSERRRSAIARLRRKGEHRAAAEAERMPHVLPPKPAGALAALRGNPGAAVIFAVHTGLGLAAQPRDIYRDMPIGRTLRSHMWLIPAAERPIDPEQQVAWLGDRWKQIDQWIAEHQSGVSGPDL